MPETDSMFIRQCRTQIKRLRRRLKRRGVGTDEFSDIELARGAQAVVNELDTVGGIDFGTIDWQNILAADMVVIAAQKYKAETRNKPPRPGDLIWAASGDIR